MMDRASLPKLPIYARWPWAKARELFEEFVAKRQKEATAMML